MSDHRLWNLAKKQDKARVTRDKSERADISGSEVGHVRPTSLELSLGTGYVRTGDLVAEESG
jgi:hypothetical protein